MKKKEKGFSILEVLVFVGLMALLIISATPNLWYGRRKASLDSDAEKLANIIRQTKKNSISIREVADLGTSPTPFYNNVFLGYAVHLELNNPNYHMYEVWTNEAGESASLANTIKLRKKNYTLEWSSISAITPIPGENSLVLLFEKLTGNLVSSVGFNSSSDAVELILQANYYDSMKKKLYISRSGMVSYTPTAPV